MANIILTTVGTGGDVFPFITIGAALKSRGHRVTLLTQSYYSGAARKAELGFAAIDSLEEFERAMRDGTLLKSPKGHLTFFYRHVLPKVPVECELIRKYYSTGNTVLVTRSEPGVAARLMSEHLGIPIVAVHMAPASVLGLPTFEQLARSTIGPGINDLCLRLGLREIENWESWLRYRTSVGLWPDWFCLPGPNWPPGIHLVGFVLSDNPGQGIVDDQIRQALTNGSHTVLLTAGTGLFGGPSFFEIAVEACRIAGCRALLVSRRQELVPLRLPEGCKYFPIVPSLGALMTHVSAVCHHGGMGTLGQAIAAGTPQIIVAAGGDRPDNAARLEKLGVAEFIAPHQHTPERVADALGRLISSDHVKRRCQELAGRFNEISPLDMTCEIIERAIQPGIIC